MKAEACGPQLGHAEAEAAALCAGDPASYTLALDIGEARWVSGEAGRVSGDSITDVRDVA